MPRVNFVKKAQQRYAMVPVIDPETGQPKRVKVMVTKSVRQEDGSYEKVQVPKTNKRGIETSRRITIADKDKPLPNLRCDFPGCDIDNREILPGTPYKFISVKRQYGGVQYNRHAAHPSWQVWEYSDSMSARVARTQKDMHDALDAFEFGTVDDFEAAKDELRDMAQGMLDEQEDVVSNMPEQLQDGSQAQQYAEALESWVDEFENADQPDESMNEEECQQCAGTGKVENPDYDSEDPEGTEEEEIDCDAEGCEDGTVKTDEPSEDWIEAARDALREAIDAAEL
jgi:hypothetical protein